MRSWSLFCLQPRNVPSKRRAAPCSKPRRDLAVFVADMFKANGVLRWAIGALLMCGVSTVLPAETQPIQNVLSRPGMTLSGKWHVIVDPYENGYYDYRREPFDAAKTPRGGFFLDRKPADRSELIEYDFDTSP